MTKPVAIAFSALAGLASALLAGCSQPASKSSAPSSNDLARYEAVLRQHVPVLSSDEFGGRAPASPGETKTLAYLEQEFRALGLSPGNGDSYLQAVPVTEITVPPTPLLIRGQGFERSFAYGEEAMLGTLRQVPSITLDHSELVFVGYGINAPEYRWNDYQDLDMAGKTAVILVNDPGFASQDPGLFKGNTMTYYGRWTYKFEEAARQGAAAALIIHATEAAGYPWSVVSSSWSGPQVTLTDADQNRDRVQVEGWLTADSARELFRAAKLDFDDLARRAAQRNFRSVPMGLRASTKFDVSLRTSITHNLLAQIPGRERPDEAVIYTAHWDHLGTRAEMAGDNIYNGALDNATGIAGLLAIAERFQKTKPAPARSILFLATTSEESGLLGARYYAEHPVIAPAQTVAAINMDSLAILGPTRDVSVVGFGSSELEQYLARAATAQNRVIVQEDNPEKGLYYRSDHFAFAKAGVPALYAKSGVEHLEKGAEWMRAQRDDYTAARYHQPSDEYDPSWDLRGAALDLELYFDIGYTLANSRAWPAWYAGSEFKAAREKSRKGY